MTYPLIVLPFVAVTAAVVLATLRRPRFGRRMASCGIAAGVLVALTAVFDNVMIANNLIEYPPEHLSGIKIGIAPIEDFSYSVCAAFLVPAVYVLLDRRPARESDTRD
jgi:lycopene cyclase domain-containing protein